MAFFLLNIIEAQGVKNVETRGSSDPYAEATFRGNRTKTKKISNNLNPKWSEQFKVSIEGKPLAATEVLQIKVFDHERLARDRFLGQVDIPFTTVIERGVHEDWHNLKEADNSPGQIKIRLEYHGENTKGSAHAERGEAVAGQPAGGDDDVDEDDEQDAAGGKHNKNKKRNASSKGGRPRTIRARVAKEYTDTVGDFQVRLTIHEARSLAGERVDAGIKASIAKQIRQTKIKKATSSPFFNEHFVFTFRNSASKLFTETVEIAAYNANCPRKDMLIGSISFDLGLVYEEPGHEFHRKWVMLASKGEGEVAAVGYVKISIVVLGAGDQAVVHDDNSIIDDEEDIEGNLLQPSDVALNPVSLVARIYRAEQLPQMDPSYLLGFKPFDRFTGQLGRELCDPYCVVSFAGNELRTKYVESSYQPEWKVEIHLPVKLPSMCDAIKIRVEKIMEKTSYRLRVEFIGASKLAANGAVDVYFEVSIGLTGDPLDPQYKPGMFSTHPIATVPDGCGGYSVTWEANKPVVDLSSDWEDVNVCFRICSANAVRAVVQKFRAALETLRELAAGTVGAQLETEILPSGRTIRVSKRMKRGKVDIDESRSLTEDEETVAVPTTDRTRLRREGGMLVELPPVVVVTSADSGSPTTTAAFVKLQPKIAYARRILNRIVQALKQPLPELPSLGTPLDERMKRWRQEEFSTAALDLLDAIEAMITESSMEGPLPRTASGNKYLGEAIGIRDHAGLAVMNALSSVEKIMTRIERCVIEPQVGIPDIFIWLRRGSTRERLAYARINPINIFFGTSETTRGEWFGKLQHLVMNQHSQVDHAATAGKTPALLSARIWFGSTATSGGWQVSEGILCALSETFEMQKYNSGWREPAAWTDATGKQARPRDECGISDGWKWDGDWYISPTGSRVDLEIGHNVVLDIAFENECAEFLQSWHATNDVRDPPHFCNQSRQEVRTAVINKQTVPDPNNDAPRGWQWSEKLDTWKLDDRGWEYASSFNSSNWHTTKGRFDYVRRRRWTRERIRVSAENTAAAAGIMAGRRPDNDEWEYAPGVNGPFHFDGEHNDKVRRRRWHRKRISTVENQSAVSAEMWDNVAYGAGGFIVYEDFVQVELRAHIYQARDLPGEDSSGLSDPFLHISFGNKTVKSLTLKQTVSPIFDQVIVISHIRVYGSTDRLMENMPPVVVDCFDEDRGGCDFLGRFTVIPTLRTSEKAAADLQWHKFQRKSVQKGELLASFNVIMHQHSRQPGFTLPNATPAADNSMVVRIPAEMRPKMRSVCIDVLAWGVRRLNKTRGMYPTSPHAQFECSGIVQQTNVIANTKVFSNFNARYYRFTLDIPEVAEYMPPLTISLYDHRKVLGTVLVGVHQIHGIDRFIKSDGAIRSMLNPATEPTFRPIANEPAGGTAISIPTGAGGGGGGVEETHELMQMQNNEIFQQPHTDANQSLSEFDWWTKFHASLQSDAAKKPEHIQQYHGGKLQILSGELENVYNLDDTIESFTLVKGRDSDDQDVAGIFKGAFVVFNAAFAAQVNESVLWPSLPSNQPAACIVRVYVVRGLDLAPQDLDGKSDPYILVKVGKRVIADDRNNYIPGDLNPTFGKMFEFEMTFPCEDELTVTVMDWDRITADDVIGETKIDLESRLLSQKRATVGLPEIYYKSGPLRWRDAERPSRILLNICQKRGFTDYSVEVMKRKQTKIVLFGHEFESPLAQTDEDHDSAHENAALVVLHSLGLVSEHVESRPLWNPMQPGIEQGKLQMWVDIFPKSLGMPPSPVDITPRKPVDYELRVIIWDTKDCEFRDVSVFGERMSDLYVKCFLTGQEAQRQKTDVHYRSLNGEGNFNWRMKFPVNYLPHEDVFVHEEKAHLYSLVSETKKTPAQLTVQIWDNDIFSSDDYIGNLELNLAHMISPEKHAKNVMATPVNAKRVNLFKKKRLRGWFPCTVHAVNRERVSGKVDMELELLSKSESEARPNGQARQDPNQFPTLDPPHRPASSFLWFTNPWKSFRYIIWTNLKWYFLGFLLLALLILFIFLVVYSLPTAIANRWVS